MTGTRGKMSEKGQDGTNTTKRDNMNKMSETEQVGGDMKKWRKSKKITQEKKTFKNLKKKCEKSPGTILSVTGSQFFKGSLNSDISYTVKFIKTQKK